MNEAELMHVHRTHTPASIFRSIVDHILIDNVQICVCKAVAVSWNKWPRQQAFEMLPSGGRSEQWTYFHFNYKLSIKHIYIFHGAYTRTQKTHQRKKCI